MFTNKFVERSFSIHKENGINLITDVWPDCQVHALKIPQKALNGNIPLYLKTFDYDIVYCSRMSKEKKSNISLSMLNTNRIYIDFFDLNKDIYRYSINNQVELVVIYYTSYKNELEITPRDYIMNILGNEVNIDEIIIFINSKVTQQDIIDTFSSITYNITLYSTLQGILQLNPEELAEVITSGGKVYITDRGEPDTVLQGSIAYLQDNFHIKLIVNTSNYQDDIKSDRFCINTEFYKDALIPKWLFERMIIEGNVMVYNKTGKLDIFPSRVNNFDIYDDELPLIIITNSKYDLQFCYNIYLLEKYLQTYNEVLN